eukprot:TRINITY_DN6332_c0_g2_i3.p1 TRINITY_DN6332_c0_g2~~TRINITY_DN6332_c0_g2_i3.p1  ORF type:complete len:709 (+),score=141.16 TRINITY_DN6332_c0_g2_i3:28-2154(+)
MDPPAGGGGGDHGGGDHAPYCTPATPLCAADPFSPVFPDGRSPVDLGGNLVFGRVRSTLTRSSASPLTPHGAPQPCCYFHSQSPQTPPTPATQDALSPLIPVQLWTGTPAPLSSGPRFCPFSYSGTASSGHHSIGTAPQRSPVPAPHIGSGSPRDGRVEAADASPTPPRGSKPAAADEAPEGAVLTPEADTPPREGSRRAKIGAVLKRGDVEGDATCASAGAVAMAPPRAVEAPGTPDEEAPTQQSPRAAVVVPATPLSAASEPCSFPEEAPAHTPGSPEAAAPCRTPPRHVDPHAAMTPEARSEQRALLQSVRSSASVGREMAALPRPDLPHSRHRMPTGGKGLENPPGHNNCFLNVVLQALYHLAPFRRRMQEEVDRHTCTEKVAPKTCLFCSIHNLFVQYQHGERPVLPPYLVRQCLVFVFSDEGRFKLGAMEDVAECFEAVLLRLHLTACDKVDYCAPPCFVHRTFGCSVLQHAVCAKKKCTTLIDPFVYNATVQYFPASVFTGCQCSAHGTAKSPCTPPLETCLRAFLDHSHTPPCKDCSKTTSTLTYLLEVPEIFSMGLIWDQSRPPAPDFMASFVQRIPATLCLSAVYRIPGAGEATGKQGCGATIRTSLASICCFYGLHYTCYCLSAKGKWLYFDDSRVTKVGSLDDVRLMIAQRRQQPVLLLFHVLPQGSVQGRKGTPNPKRRTSMSKFSFAKFFRKHS